MAIAAIGAASGAVLRKLRQLPARAAARPLPASAVALVAVLLFLCCRGARRSARAGAPRVLTPEELATLADDESGNERATCEFGLWLPNPFLLSVLRAQYEPLKRWNAGKVALFWSREKRAARQLAADCGARRAFRRLMDDGLVVRRLGLDFSGVQQQRYGVPTARGAELAADADALRLAEAYFSTPAQRFFWSVDMPSWYRQATDSLRGLSPHERSLLEAFWRDGFVRIDRYPGLDAASLDPGRLPAAREALQPLLRQGSLLRQLVHGYLRSAEVSYHGAQHSSLPKGCTRGHYDNALWHHDGCGQRVKAFIYLTDVDEDSHHTLIAAGTHRTHWYPTTQYFAGGVPGLNKLNASLVQEEYGPVITRMLGKRGGGFLFDTNTLHCADMRGLHKQRDVFILDFASQEHMQKMPRSQEYKPGHFPEGVCPTAGHPERVLWKL